MVILSGDRTPKQKVKLKVTEEKLLNLMLKYNGGRARAEVPFFETCDLFTKTCSCTISLLLINLQQLIVYGVNL